MGASPSKNFSIENIPNLSQKVIVVTGGNTGIGLAISKGFASKSPEKLIIAGRNQSKVDDAVAVLKKEFPNSNAVGLIVDLSSFSSIEAFGDNLANIVDRVDILVNNAGIFLTPFSKTQEGFEITLGTNAIGTAYLTNQTLPLILRSTAPRVVFLSSNAVSYVTPTIFSKYIPDIGGEKLSETTLEIYSVSKFYNTAYAYALQKKYPKLIVTSAHPGFIKSDIQSKTNKDLFLARLVGNYLAPALAKPVEYGALSSLYCATAPVFETNPELRGQFFDEGPYGKLFRSLAVFTPANSSRVFQAIEDAIKSKSSRYNQL